MTETPERLLRLADVKARVGLGKSKIYELVAEGGLPKPYKLTATASRWHENEIEAWLADVISSRS
ncbi:hypothetical protein ASE00_09885 [Sphingomonas sp. Root710]|uniref:helix-turn-helix transcriptional regulator n=1 Tax=Sphingomonas sp. Root710 TaxID=1736594 RepID=UPI0006F9E0C6|nr:AlpA family phage regulatory protein [Sphingomonas sp. Root710]KRB82369.1 hypothetical protein ASE00_09885 [Sphingomonas sp. Root710]